MAILNESVKNLFNSSDEDKKKKYMNQVWKILQDSYASQGGIKGNGFKNPMDMLNIPFWKLDIVDEKVLAVLMYKFTPISTDKENLRKLCALGVVSDEDKNLAKVKLKNILKQEFERSILEVSGNLEAYLMRNFPVEYKNYQIPVEEVKIILFLDDIIPVDKFRYKRIIGGENHEKIMLGSKIGRY